MAAAKEIVSFGGQAAADRFSQNSTSSTHEFYIVMRSDGWAELTIGALLEDVFLSPTNKKLSSWFNTDADDVSVGGKLKYRIPKDEARKVWFTASERFGGFSTTYVITSPRVSHAKKTKLVVGVH